MNTNINTYAKAGVNVAIGDRASHILYQSSRRTWDNRVGKIGEVRVNEEALSAPRYSHFSQHPDACIGMNFDGVGTKVELAERIGDHSSIAWDLMAMVCDDAARLGAEPIHFGSILDFNTIDLQIVQELASGMEKAACEAAVAVVNGEIAELGDRIQGYGKVAYSWGGSIAWAAKKDRLLTGRSIKSGQSVVAVKEIGLRSNGLSLIRKVYEKIHGPEWHRKQFKKSTLGKAALTPSIIYTRLMVSLTGGYSHTPKCTVQGLAHITGGGIPSKLGRVIAPSACGAELDNLFEPCPLMTDCQMSAGITSEEAYKTWNMGNGLLIVSSEPEAVLSEANTMGFEARIAGRIVEEKGIRIKSQCRTNQDARWLKFPL